LFLWGNHSTLLKWAIKFRRSEKKVLQEYIEKGSADADGLLYRLIGNPDSI
jgi:hypothetical protein